jgi:hypothetical protein
VAEFPFLKRTIQDYGDGAARHGLTTTSLGMLKNLGFRNQAAEANNTRAVPRGLKRMKQSDDARSREPRPVDRARSPAPQLGEQRQVGCVDPVLRPVPATARCASTAGNRPALWDRMGRPRPWLTRRCLAWPIAQQGWNAFLRQFSGKCDVRGA